MKTKTDWGKCARCGKKITDENFGDKIEAEEISVCKDCSKKHNHNVITQLNKFKKSKEFNNILELRKRMLWTSEKMGHWGDSSNKETMESVTDYDDWSVEELQEAIRGIIMDLKERENPYDDL